MEPAASNDKGNEIETVGLGRGPGNGREGRARRQRNAACRSFCPGGKPSDRKSRQPGGHFPTHRTTTTTATTTTHRALCCSYLALARHDARPQYTFGPPTLTASCVCCPPPTVCSYLVVKRAWPAMIHAHTSPKAPKKTSKSRELPSPLHTCSYLAVKRPWPATHSHHLKDSKS